MEARNKQRQLWKDCGWIKYEISPHSHVGEHLVPSCWGCLGGGCQDFELWGLSEEVYHWGRALGGVLSIATSCCIICFLVSHTVNTSPQYVPSTIKSCLLTQNQANREWTFRNHKLNHSLFLLGIWSQRWERNQHTEWEQWDFLYSRFYGHRGMLLLSGQK